MGKGAATGILRHHLENLSGEVFEQYPEVVREVIRGHAGVYALYRGDRLYYVGLASNLMARVKQHFKDRHQQRWDRFSVYLTEDSRHMRELESLLLRIARPSGNRVVGRLGKSGDLHGEFAKLAQKREADRLKRLLGSKTGLLWQRRQPKAKAATVPAASAAAKKSATAGKVFVLLRRTYKGKAHKAFLRANGTVKLNDKVYPSPSGAARAVVGAPVNGWTFWKCLDENRKWVSLDSLRSKSGERKG